MVAMLRDKGGKLQESLSGMQVVAYCESIVAEFQVTHKILFHSSVLQRPKATFGPCDC